jgi:phosphoglycerol transferase MdoB-like AlkP superfamily enzyme
MNQTNNIYLFILISIVFVGIPALVYFKKALNQSEAFVSLIYNTAITGVIGLLAFGSLLILYSLYTNKYEEYAYIATIGLAVFTAMTILIFHFPTNPNETISFTKNLSIFGGLMLLSQRFVR